MLNYLESFLSLADTLSFSATARALSVSQPSVSRQIKLLEEQLQTRLFIRDRHTVHLTPQGKAFAQDLAPLFGEIQRRLRSTRSGHDALEGRINFGSLTEVGQHVFMPWILDFRARYPGLRISVEFLREAEITGRIKAGTLDFGVVSSVIERENVRAYKLFHEQVVLVTRAKNKVTPEKLKSPQVVAYRRDDPMLKQYARFFFPKEGLKSLEIQLSVNSHRSMIETLLATDAFAVMPIHSLQREIDDGPIKVIAGHKIRNPLHLIQLENRLMEKKHALFSAYLRERAKGLSR